MNFDDFSSNMSPARTGRYLYACAGDKRKAMTLYRKNIKISSEMFAIVSCFEVALRNSINTHYQAIHTIHWLRNSIQPGGLFANPQCHYSKQTIQRALSKLQANYTPNKLVAELGFGFWRFMFAGHQFQAAGGTLLQIFPSKPQSTPQIQYNANYVLQQLAKINKIRNRIAHHEPICFLPGQSVKDTHYVRTRHNMIVQLLRWMNIDPGKLLYGLDHINKVCDEIDAI